MTHRDADARSIGFDLERQRLAHRAGRIRRALEAMRQLARDRGPAVPAPLRLGITDFDRELDRVERRLRELDGGDRTR